MTVYAIVGTYDDIVRAGHMIKGNGKNMTATYYSAIDYQLGNPVLTNYKTSFSDYLDTQDIIETVLTSEYKKISIVIDEMSLFLNSIGEKQKILKFIMRLVKQSRKIKCKLYWIEQRYLDVHKRLRIHTNYVLEPEKYHYDGTLCTDEECERTDHFIDIFSQKPWLPAPIARIDCNAIGSLYNTDEILLDEINVNEIDMESILQRKKMLNR